MWFKESRRVKGKTEEWFLSIVWTCSKYQKEDVYRVLRIARVFKSGKSLGGENLSLCFMVPIKPIKGEYATMYTT